MMDDWSFNDHPDELMRLIPRFRKSATEAAWQAQKETNPERKYWADRTAANLWAHYNYCVDRAERMGLLNNEKGAAA